MMVCVDDDLGYSMRCCLSRNRFLSIITNIMTSGRYPEDSMGPG